MKQYHIGLDFGTYQSKACIYDVEKDTHEFFRFTDGKFFLLSRVTKTADNKFLYGDSASNSFCYFKIAAAEDEEFHSETFGSNRSDPKYQINEFENFTPEFLSVIFLTYMLLTIKEKYKLINLKQAKTGGLLSRIFQRQEEQEEVRFTVQLGIPTEWSQQKNLRRKRKFENILMLSELLQKKYDNKDVFLNASDKQLLKDVTDIYNSYNFSDKDAFDLRLNELGISVYPETAAGLTFIMKTKQLLPGYYAIMDVGGGSTDISFFKISKTGVIRYLASECYLIAANTVYRKFSGEPNSISRLEKAERDVGEEINSDKWEQNILLKSILNEVNKNLCQLVYKLFNKRVYWFNNAMIENYKNHPIILYGGGSQLPILRSGNILIHDHGCKDSLNLPFTYLEKQKMNKYTSIININPNDGSWEKDFPLLVVALGLSFIKPTSSADWFNDSDYQARDGDRAKEIPHPFNEGYYIYDVLNSRWK